MMLSAVTAIFTGSFVHSGNTALLATREGPGSVLAERGDPQNRAGSPSLGRHTLAERGGWELALAGQRDGRCNTDEALPTKESKRCFCSL